MKTKLTFIFAALLMLSGCNWFKDLGEVTFSTDLTMDVPVVVGSTAKAADINVPESSVPFSASADLALEDNSDIEPYLQKIREIDLKSVQVTVTGLTAGQVINTISLSVAGVGTICTHTNITSATGVFTPSIDAEKLNQAAAKLKSDKAVTVTVSGTASGPMAFNVGILFDTEVTAGALD